MSSIGSLSSSIASSYLSASSATRQQRPDPAKMAEALFSQLDTSGKGYIEQSDLASALSGVSASSSSQNDASASEIFSQLDSDGDGKVTQDEMTSSFTKLAEALDEQFNQSRIQGGMPPPPPPPPKGDDTGFAKDELSSQLSEIGSSDSAQGSLISNIVNNFDAADTNQDGKVSFQEATAYDRANPSTTDSTSSTSSTASATATSEKTDAQIFRQIMELLHSYGAGTQDAEGASGKLASLISTAA